MNRDLFGNEMVIDELLRDKFIEPPFSVLDTKHIDNLLIDKEVVFKTCSDIVKQEVNNKLMGWIFRRQLFKSIFWDLKCPLLGSSFTKSELALSPKSQINRANFSHSYGCYVLKSSRMEQQKNIHPLTWIRRCSECSRREQKNIHPLTRS